MKSIQSLIPGLLFISAIISCRQNKILVQRPEKGMDTYVHEYHPNRNFNWDTKIAVMAWTFSGTPGNCRGLIRFDLSSIPVRAKVTKAELYLYHVTDQGNNPQHSQLSGANAGYLMQVSSSWSADSVTWSNQPAVISESQVVLPASTSETQDYVVDVTAMVSNMVKQPANNNGFMIRLQNEDYYRALMFASSNHKNLELHPTLKVYYK
ncbi:DNRLRE domain-containing protein [Chitinophaga tropicalis]|uniref:DNRLRE domain-containing protein n=1 Tax=Chitinophaga tropicalis TaxID=2683588 RepID=A0A7K1UE94_9BACT|nr:DNRLRE domain-containing protein [Chitinophaga tropicalis]MVT12608.1 DNRLRE domain-containing protein [Chitinophaga tropicalis]